MWFAASTELNAAAEVVCPTEGSDRAGTMSWVLRFRPNKRTIRSSPADPDEVQQQEGEAKGGGHDQRRPGGPKGVEQGAAQEALDREPHLQGWAESVGVSGRMHSESVWCGTGGRRARMVGAGGGLASAIAVCMGWYALPAGPQAAT